MAKLTRPSSISVFASQALDPELTVFGSTTQSKDINLLLNSTDSQRGWGVVGANGIPPMEWFNAMGYSLSYYSSYLMQQGVAEWVSTQNYYINSYAVGSDGKLYRSKTGIDETPNVGNNPVVDTVNWGYIIDISSIVHSATEKTSVLADDEFLILDSGSSFGVKKVKKNTLKNEFSNGSAGFKNYIIDGNFNFWYEATSTSITFNGIGSPYASTMWKCGRANTTFAGVATISSIVGGGLKVQPTVADTSLTGGDMATLMQSLEGNNIANLAGKTVTLSFTVNTNKLGDYGIGFYDGTGLAYLTPKKYTVAATGKTRYSISFAMPSTITKDTSGRFDIHFTLAADATRSGSLFPTGVTIVNLFDSISNYFEIYEVQLEEGSVATDFQYNPIGIEEIRVMRYFEKSYDNNTYFSGARITATTTFQGATIEFKVAKRSVPVMTLYSFAGTAGTIDFQGTGSLITNLTAAADRITTHKCGIYSASTAGMTIGQSGYCIGGFKADARL